MRTLGDKVRMKDVAREAGVTVGTVSAVLRGSRDRIFYSDETRERILGVVGRLGYRVNHAARSLREGKTRTVGVILDDITLPFLASLICGVGKALEPHGYSIILCAVDASEAARESLLQVLARGHVDSFMLAGALGNLTDRDILDIHSRGHHVVLIERESPSPAIPSVRVDNSTGGGLAAAHLLKRGCRRLVVLGGPAGNPMSRQRAEGAQAVWRKGGGATSDVAVLASGGWTADFGYEAVSRHLASGAQPDGVFACNDLLAIGAMRALNEKGFAVPDAAAVVGFDDSPLAAFALPPLSTIRQPVDLMGKAAAELLVARPSAEMDLQRRFSPELIVRRSA